MPRKKVPKEFKYPFSYSMVHDFQECLYRTAHAHEHDDPGDFIPAISQDREAGKKGHAMIHRMLSGHDIGVDNKGLEVEYPLPVEQLRRIAISAKKFVYEIVPNQLGIRSGNYRAEQHYRLRCAPYTGREASLHELFPPGFVPTLVGSSLEAHVSGIMDFVGWVPEHREIYLIDFKLYSHDYIRFQMFFYAVLAHWGLNLRDYNIRSFLYVLDPGEGAPRELIPKDYWSYDQIDYIQRRMISEIYTAVNNQEKGIIPKKCYYCKFCPVRFAGACKFFEKNGDEKLC